MSKKDGKINYELQKPIKISERGAFIDCTFIELREPTGDHSSYYLKLLQKIEQGIAEVSVKFQNADEEQVQAGEEVKPFYEQSENPEEQKQQETSFRSVIMQSNIDIDFFILTFKKMIVADGKKPIALCNGTVKIKNVDWDKIYPNDRLGLAVRWCFFFVMPSIGGLRTISEQL